jgi:nuclear transport factor 2 (NTF2) superfamily protein
LKPKSIRLLFASSNSGKAVNETKPTLPPFNLETAKQKVRTAENAWNTCHPEKISLAYTINSQWRNRSTFITGRDQILLFLKDK